MTDSPDAVRDPSPLSDTPASPLSDAPAPEQTADIPSAAAPAADAPAPAAMEAPPATSAPATPTTTAPAATPAIPSAATTPRSATTTARTAPRKKRRKRLPPGWIPDQHGAWAMISIPALTGVILAGFNWIHIPLLLFWWIGYFFFQAAMLWLKARRRPKYFPPVRAYGIALIPFAAIIAVFKPYLAVWVVAFAPLIAVAVWCTVNRKERTYLNDSATVLAACLMMAVTFHAVADHGDPRWTWVWLVLGVQFAYFWGTIPHVKALIRERHRIEAARQSVLFHAIGALAVTVLVGLGWFDRTLWGGWFLVLVWWLLVARAYLMPWWQRRTKPLRPAVIGFTEVAFSLAIAAALLL